MAEEGGSQIEQSESIRTPQEGDLGKPLSKEIKTGPDRNRFISQFLRLLRQRDKSKEETIGVATSKEPVSEQSLSLDEMKKSSHILSITGADNQRAQELLDILSKHTNLILESGKSLPDNDYDFVDSLEIIRDFFRYYEKRLSLEKIYEKSAPKKSGKMPENAYGFADFASSFLHENIQGIDSRLHNTSGLADKTVFLEAVSGLSRFGSKEQSKEAVDVLLKHFDKVLIESKAEYTTNGQHSKLFENISPALGAIFEKGDSYQIDNGMGIIETYLRSDDDLMKKVIANEVLRGIKDKAAAKKVLRVILEEYKVDPEKTIKNWDASTTISPDSGILVGTWNLANLINLESKAPGVGSILNSEFGISDFARYPEDLLIAQYEDKDKNDGIPYGVLIYPKADWNQAYYNRVETLKDLFDQLKGRFRIRAFEADDTLELVHVLNQSRKRWGKISFAIIGGHGTGESIRFGASDEESSQLKKEDVERSGASALSLAFVENPTIILSSCSSGELGGIGQEISKIGANVIAPPEPTFPESIDPIFLEDGRIDFRVKYHQTPSNTYSLGEHEGRT